MFLHGTSLVYTVYINDQWGFKVSMELSGTGIGYIRKSKDFSSNDYIVTLKLVET